jgi:hypothetical protein
MIENIIKKYKYLDLTGQDIYNVIQKYPVEYSDLKNYNSIEDLCPRDSPYQVLLYQVSNKGSGHFVSIWIDYDTDTIYFFDSYGYSPDMPLKLGLVNYDLENYPFLLTNLLKKSNKKLYFNKIDYQSKQDVKVSTCGRWSVFAIKMRGLFPNDFNRIFSKTNKSQYLNDQDNLITLLTLTYFNDFESYFNI